jgi:hypothetical protein
VTPIEASIVAAGEIELAPDVDGGPTDWIGPAVLLQFDSRDDLHRFLEGEAATGKWIYMRPFKLKQESTA